MDSASSRILSSQQTMENDMIVKKPFDCVLSIDQGTQSTRCFAYSTDLSYVASARHSHTQIYKKPGWVEHDPVEIFDNCIKSINETIDNIYELKGSNVKINIKCIGIANQRETLIVWNRETGIPYYNAIVWLDSRTDELVSELSEKYDEEKDIHAITGLRLASYFSGVKFLWLYNNVAEIKKAVDNNEACIGTVDSWVIYNLTSKKEFKTDICNASRTLLLDIKSKKWSEKMCKIFNVNIECLPTILSNCDNFGVITANGLKSELYNVPISGCAGDQHAACVGQKIIRTGEAKCTFGTGAFFLVNTGTDEPVLSKNGLLTTPLFQLGSNCQPQWGLEGSIAVAGAVISWLTDRLPVIKSEAEIEKLIKPLSDTGGVTFVTAYSGLFAPRWKRQAKACVLGMTQYTSRGHIVLAALEAVAFQVAELVEALKKDFPSFLNNTHINCDGGMCKNDRFMQLCADISGARLTLQSEIEATGLGAAMCACIGAGMYKTLEDFPIKKNRTECVFYPQIAEEIREEKKLRWNRSVEKSLDC